MNDKRVYQVGQMDVPGATNRKGPHYGAYQCWNKMLKFSYSDKPAKASMCEEWHTFSNFLGWYVDNVPQGKGASVHRKPGCLHYSPETVTARVPKKKISLKDIHLVYGGQSVSMEALLQQMRENLAA